jgi:hypothetical protein
MTGLLFKPAIAAAGEVYDVLDDHTIVGRIMLTEVKPVSPWVSMLAYGHREDRTPTHGYEATREGAMQAFARSWRKE